MDQSQSGSLKFPKGFLFGAATAAHQIEGGNINDWSEWEKLNAERLARRSGRDAKNHISGLAANSYKLFREDIALMKKLGLKAYRFSVEWSRIEPQEGKFDDAAIAHYQEQVRLLLENGIEPFVSLWHWTIPLWVRNQGGWKNKQTIEDFVFFAKKIVEALPQVKFWITLNEPTVYANKSYRQGDWPPQKTGLSNYFKALGNLVEAHKLAYGVIKKISPNSMAGVANHLNAIEGPWPFVNIAKYWANEYFLKKIKNFQDFIGLNHYFHNRLFKKNANVRVSDMGWELYPRGIYLVLKDLKKYQKPIYITEHGLADADDINREWYIEESLKWIRKAVDEGVDVRGYLHWSLLDNFEWADGFWPRFGLIEVDYDNNFKRTVRPSAWVYADLIKKYSHDLP